MQKLMKIESGFNEAATLLPLQKSVLSFVNGKDFMEKEPNLAEIVFITSYPPRECGIATYSLDLVKALRNQFGHSFKIRICPIESTEEKHFYTGDDRYLLDTEHPDRIVSLVKEINNNDAISIVLVQHEFGLFEKKEDLFRYFIQALTKPVVIVFHTVLPSPNPTLLANVQSIASVSDSLIVMTHSSANILEKDYGISLDKITIIPHGTHLVAQADKEILKKKYNLSGRKILSTFGLLSSGKSIETTLDALPAIIRQNKHVLFLIIGKTHPSVVKREGEAYRQMLKKKVNDLYLQGHVLFINQFLPLPVLLEYLQLSDIYLFTSKDPNQAVSGTFSYAISCGCPVISTPIPHAVEVLQNDTGIIVDFGNSEQLGEAVTNLLNNEEMRKRKSFLSLEKIAPTAWENSAIAHARLFKQLDPERIRLQYNIPAINLEHIKNLTTDFGMIQFSTISQSDILSGYTLDDNARALIAICQHFELTKDINDLSLIRVYFNFISYCQQWDGTFLNYVNEKKQFTIQNKETNLEDANGRAIWALGYLISLNGSLPIQLLSDAMTTMQKALVPVQDIHSTRAMAFIIKGLYYSGYHYKPQQNLFLIKEFANRLVQMYRHEADGQWLWYESYLTYANSLLPEALLCAWMATGDIAYRDIAIASFDFLLSKTIKSDNLCIISNKTWLHKGNDFLYRKNGGEQPIDVAYTILALAKFHTTFPENGYKYKMEVFFNWFLGANHLHQIIYNPCTGGCYDGLEENCININQGAESTVSYLMARLTMGKIFSDTGKSGVIDIR